MNGPSIWTYRNRPVEKMIDRQYGMTVEEKRKYTLEHALGHLFGIRFFERKYMRPDFIEGFPMYTRIREDYFASKYRVLVAKRPWSSRFRKPRNQLFPEEAMSEWNAYRMKQEKLYQREKWPMFLHWLLYHPEEWSFVDGSNGRLNFLRQEFLDASYYGLTPEMFVNCIVNEWRSCSDVVRRQDRHDFASLFERFVPQPIPSNIAFCCSALLEATLNVFPLTMEEESVLMNNWDFEMGKTVSLNGTT